MTDPAMSSSVIIWMTVSIKNLSPDLPKLVTILIKKCARLVLNTCFYCWLALNLFYLNIWVENEGFFQNLLSHVTLWLHTIAQLYHCTEQLRHPSFLFSIDILVEISAFLVHVTWSSDSPIQPCIILLHWRYQTHLFLLDISASSIVC